MVLGGTMLYSMAPPPVVEDAGGAVTEKEKAEREIEAKSEPLSSATASGVDATANGSGLRQRA
jgi:hypothetical protein